MKLRYKYFILLIFSLWSFIACANKPSKQPEIDFSGVNIGDYYLGRVDETRMFVRFDTVGVDYTSGIYFYYNDEAYAEIYEFNLRRKRQSFIIKSDEFIAEIRINIQIRDGLIGGTFRVNNKFLGIFNRYGDKKDIRLGLLHTPEFLRYPDRYAEPVFEDILEVSDVTYGFAKGYWVSFETKGESYWKILERGMASSVRKREHNLDMDIYSPLDDTLKKRPIIVFIHGGGFYIGDKATTSFVEWCRYFASLGYLTASINYRIGFKPMNYSVERAGYRAVQDAHAAIRYLVQHQEILAIDTSLIFVAGSSAGGITSLNLAFMRNHNRPRSSFGNIMLEDLLDIESSGNLHNHNFSIKAAVNMWGALNDLDMLENSKTSVLSVHGTDDKVVPYGYDFPFKDVQGGISKIVFSKIYGSLPIHQRLRVLGVREKLITLENWGHSPHVDENNEDVLNENFYMIQNEIRDFLYPEILPNKAKISTIRPTTRPLAQIAYIARTADFAKLHWKIEGGLIISTHNNSIRVVWFPEAPVKRLHLSVLHNSGASSYDVYEFV